MSHSDDDLDDLLNDYNSGVTGTSTTAAVAARAPAVTPVADAALDDEEEALLREMMGEETSAPQQPSTTTPTPPTSAAPTTTRGPTPTMANPPSSPIPPTPSFVAPASSYRPSTGMAKPSSSAPSPFSVDDEDQILQAILGALQDEQSSVSTEMGADTFEIEAVLDRAEQLAMSIASGGTLDAGNSVLQLHENHVLKEEIKKAKSTTGWPTCVDSCLFYTSSTKQHATPCLCIGTTLGLVLLFNTKNKLCGVCGSAGGGGMGGGEYKGSVTAVSFSRNGQYVAAGYEKGQVVLWSTDTLQAVKTVEGELTAAVLKCMFFHPDPLRMVAFDADSNVKILSFNKVMNTVVGRCSTLYTGYETNCTDISTINDFSQVGNTNEHREVHYLATICSDSLSVFTVTFGLQTSTTLCFTGSNPKPTSHPNELVTWCRDGHDKISLLVAWSCGKVDIFRALTDDGEGVVMQITNTIDIPRPALSFSALDGPCTLLVDRDARASVIDSRVATIVETQKLVKCNLVSYSAKPNMTSYHGQISHSGGYCMLLGQSRLMFSTLLSWDARLDAVIASKRWDDAFSLAKDFSLEIAVAVVGLSSDSTVRRSALQDRITQLLTAFISDAARKKTSLRDFVPLAKKMLVFCAEIHSMDTFFNHVMVFLQTIQVKDAAIYALESALLDGTITSVPDTFIRELVELFQTPTRFNAVVSKKEAMAAASASADGAPSTTSSSRVEMALMHVQGNLNTLVAIADELQMWRLKCSILSLSLHKHVDALVCALEKDVNIAFAYLENLFRGKSLLEGKDIVPMYRKHAKERTLKYIIDTPTALSSLLKSSLGKTIQLIETLLAAHEAGDYYSPWTNTGNIVVSKLDVFNAFHAHLVDTTIPFNHPWEVERKRWPPYASVVQFYLTFAPEVAKGEIVPAQCDDFVVRCTSLCAFSFEKTNLEKRRAIQSILMVLLASPHVSSSALRTAEAELRPKRLSRVLAAVLARRLEFSEAIMCFLLPQNQELDPGLKKGVFDFIVHEMHRFKDENDQEAANALRIAVKQVLEDLVAVDATALAQFVFEYLPDDHRDVLRALQGSTETFLMYLRGMIGKGDRSVSEDKDIQNTYIRLLCLHDPTKVYPYLVAKDSDILYDIGDALDSCRRHNVTDASIFLLEKTMQIGDAMGLLMSSVTSCMYALRADAIENFDRFSKQVAEATLREKKTGPSQMSSGSLRRNSSKINVMMHDESITNKTPFDLGEKDRELKKMVSIGIDLCTRYHSKLTIDQLSQLWFQLLDRFAKPKRVLFDRQTFDHSLKSGKMSKGWSSGQQTDDGFNDNEIELADQFFGEQLFDQHQTKALSDTGVRFMDIMQHIYTAYVSLILSSMVKSLPLSVVVGKIVADNEHEKFGPFKPIVVGILETLSFDLEINRLCKLCTDSDTIKLGGELKTVVTSGLIPKSEFCGICKSHVSVQVGDVDSLRFYPCGHGFHEDCCEGDRECLVCLDAAIGDNSDLLESRRIKMEGIMTANAKGRREATRGEKGGKGDVFDTQRIMRRLRTAKNRLDSGKASMSTIDSILARGRQGGVDSSSAPLAAAIGSLQKASYANGLLLAPAPQPQTSVSDIAIGALPQHPEYEAEVTDDDLLRIFGENGLNLQNLQQEEDEEEDPLYGMSEQERLLFANV